MSKKTLREREDLTMLRLQEGVPLVERPFAAVAEEVGLPEQEVLDHMEGWLRDGGARRFGAIFDVRRMGYASTLCAVTLEPDALDSVVPRLTPDPGITHCYLRTAAADLSPEPMLDHGGRPVPNLWFTFCALRERFQGLLDELREVVAPQPLHLLPAVRRFKIHAVFDPAKRERGESVPPMPQARVETFGGPAPGPPRNEAQRQVVRLLQGNMPFVPEPFREVASRTDYSSSELLELLRCWRTSGRLRRVALIVRHRKVGFNGNGMGVWQVGTDHIEEAGRALAALPEVTHCYERQVVESFPYNLFAMLHTARPESTRELYEDLSRRLGLEPGLLFSSIREFKKTSHRLFAES